jgi:hypothetical protein
MMTRILAALRSPGAMMLALILALFAQGEHTAQVFAYFAHSTIGNGWLLAYAFACAVEVAVLLFVLRGHKYISYGFAGATFCTNLVYYAIGGVALLSPAALPVLLLSALLPACIVGYSHTIAEAPHGTDGAVDSAPHPSTTTPVESPVARSEGMTGHPGDLTPTEQAGQTDVLAVAPPAPTKRTARKLAPVVRKRKPAKPTQEQRRAQIAESGVTDVSAIMAICSPCCWRRQRARPRR